jgi:hypothetical protein
MTFKNYNSLLYTEIEILRWKQYKAMEIMSIFLIQKHSFKGCGYYSWNDLSFVQKKKLIEVNKQNCYMGSKEESSEAPL